MPKLNLQPPQLSPCPLCGQGVARQPLQVCELCEAQILDAIPCTPALHAEYKLDGEDLLGPILLAYPALNEVFGMAEMQAWDARLRESGHLFPQDMECQR